MKVADSIAHLHLSQPTAVTIGNFDGLHLGHRAIFRCVRERARLAQCHSVAVTFDPHPIRFLAPGRAPKLITTLRQKIRTIEDIGIDALLIVTFDHDFSHLSPEAFIQEYLIDGLKARSVSVGSNFKFGHQQRGNVNTLRQWQNRFELIEVPPVRVRGNIVSSTLIREWIGSGHVGPASRLLGHFFEIEGKIAPGAGRGKNLTVPTLNLEPEGELIPKNGVYLTRMALNGGPLLDSITNVGVKPTFGDGRLTVETFILGFQDTSGAVPARLQFIKRLRDEIRFDSPEALKRKIEIDIRNAVKFFRRLKVFGHAQSHSR